MTAPQDPFVALLPDSSLAGFDRLPTREQMWRARFYWAARIWSGSTPYAWFLATRRGAADSAEMKALVGATPDGAISAALSQVEELVADPSSPLGFTQRGSL